MLVKKNVLNEINKEETSTQDFIDYNKIKRKVSQNLEDLQYLLIKLTVKQASSEKAWLLYEFPFSLNLGDKPIDAQTWKNYSSFYPVPKYRKPVPSKFKGKLMEHFRDSKLKPTKY